MSKLALLNLVPITLARHHDEACPYPLSTRSRHWIFAERMLSAKRSAGPYIRVRANGLLRADDYDRFEAEFADELGYRTVPVRLLLDMRGFRGWTPRAFLRDLVWDFRNRQTFSKIAVIGDARWHKWVTAAGALLFRGQLKYFLAIDTAAADQWLQEAPRGTRSMDV